MCYVGAGWQEGGNAVRVVGSVSTEGDFAAVENWSVDDRVAEPSPVDVGLVAIVAALFAESGLVRVDVVAMPGEEVASSMYSQREVNVSSLKVIISASGSRCEVAADGWDRLQTLYSFDVCSLLARLQRVPLFASVGGLECARRSRLRAQIRLQIPHPFARECV